VTDYVGWSATAVFVASYFCARADALRRVQMVGAAIWVVYGAMMRAYPVIVANLLVLAAAAWATAREAAHARGVDD
jgi:hypothetical protein